MNGIKRNKDISGIIDRDQIYEIDYYSNYKTTLNSNEPEKIELTLIKLSLHWRERNFDTKTNTIDINYDVSYKDITKAYDKNYVKLCMADIATIIFTNIEDVETLNINFNDNSYSITKDALKKAYKINNYSELENDWTNKVSKKLKKSEFVDKIYKLFRVK